MDQAQSPESFEASVNRLEEIVARMESGSLSLDDCLAHFEQAVSLSRQCAARLEAAEQKIRLLTGDGALVNAEEAGWSAEREIDPFAD